MQNSLPSGSAITAKQSYASCSVRRWIPPRVPSRVTSASTRRRRACAGRSPATLTRTSRCTRFLPAFGSGTRWNSTRGPVQAGSTTADQDSSVPPTAREKSASSRILLAVCRPGSRAPMPRKQPAAQDRHSQSPPGVVSLPGHHPRTARARGPGDQLTPVAGLLARDLPSAIAPGASRSRRARPVPSWPTRCRPGPYPGAGSARRFPATAHRSPQPCE
jgi:hypothetical protein